MDDYVQRWRTQRFWNRVGIFALWSPSTKGRKCVHCALELDVG